MSGPIVRIGNKKKHQDPGTTLGNLRLKYPGCYLENGDNEHLSDAFVLENGVTYDLIPSQQEGKVRGDSIASSSRKRRWNELNIVLHEVVSKSKKMDKSSTPYSSIEWSNVESIFGINPWMLEPKDIPDETVNKLFEQLLDCSDVFGTISSGKEVKRLHFIAPVLVTVAQLFKDDVDKVKILVEEDVNGINIHTNGHFEFVLQKGTRRVCIVEAKKEEMEKGMAQSLLGCEAIADLENASVVYAVVTNFLQWYFLKDTDDHIFRNATTLTTINDTPTKDSIARIAGMLYAMLSEA